MIRIAIVEDDRHDREALKKCLNRYEKENQMKFSVTLLTFWKELRKKMDT